MAVLIKEQLLKIRQSVASKLAVVDYDKPMINAATQAVEDWFEKNKSGISTDINTATAPKVLRPEVKKLIVAYWLEQKFRREI